MNFKNTRNRKYKGLNFSHVSGFNSLTPVTSTSKISYLRRRENVVGLRGVKGDAVDGAVVRVPGRLHPVAGAAQVPDDDLDKDVKDIGGNKENRSRKSSNHFLNWSRSRQS